MSAIPEHIKEYIKKRKKEDAVNREHRKVARAKRRKLNKSRKPSPSKIKRSGGGCGCKK